MKRATKQSKRKASQAQRIISLLEYHQADVDPVPLGLEWDTAIEITCDGVHYRPSMDLGKFIRKVLKDPMDPLKRATPNAPVGAAPR